MIDKKCSFCKSELNFKFADLNTSPIANNLESGEISVNKTKYPLNVYVCQECMLVQLGDFLNHDLIFKSDYPYFSSYSTSWVNHAENFVDFMCKRFKNNLEFVIEIASNDGYLLQFVKKQKIEYLGIEPSQSVANKAIQSGIKTELKYFNKQTSKFIVENYKKASFIVANNVLAHVPDINSFVDGLSFLLDKNGVISIEFPYLKNLIDNVQFDTIYHEHYYYFSLTALVTIFKKYNLNIFDVQKISTHGGSLRIFVSHFQSIHKTTNAVKDCLSDECKNSLNTLHGYKDFQKNIDLYANKLNNLLKKLKENNKKIVGFGAAAKGVTLFNYANISSDTLSYIVDSNPNKVGFNYPGTNIIINSVDDLFSDEEVDVIFIIPWNLGPEISNIIRQKISKQVDIYLCDQNLTRL